MKHNQIPSQELVSLIFFFSLYLMYSNKICHFRAMLSKTLLYTVFLDRTHHLCFVIHTYVKQVN